MDVQRMWRLHFENVWHFLLWVEEKCDASPPSYHIWYRDGHRPLLVTTYDIEMVIVPSQLPHMISRWSSLFKSANAIPRPLSLLTRISVSPATSTKVPLVRLFLIPHLHDWRKMEVCLINCTTGDWWELFKNSAIFGNGVQLCKENYWRIV
jgi:hypothetical protein